MCNKQTFITVNHLDDFNAMYSFKPGDILTLKKDFSNCYDDEAILVYNKQMCKCGYVANTVCTVARGTYSAGRIYDKFEDDDKCAVRFIAEDFMICEIIDNSDRKT